MTPHLSDEVLLLVADGEGGDARSHLDNCEDCRARLRRLEETLARVARMQRGGDASPSAEARALLRERLEGRRRWWLMPAAVAAGVVLAIAWRAGMPSGERVAMPRHELTPGAVRTVAARDVCVAGDPRSNADVLPALQHEVFQAYGMPDAERRAFEVDYLITPALGGSDDIRNLWPQPYSGSPWNAYVKDALETRLRDMVCAGQLDLATAQREIAVNWIAAYKKYFHTRQPLPQHQRGPIAAR